MNNVEFSEKLNNGIRNTVKNTKESAFVSIIPNTENERNVGH